MTSFHRSVGGGTCRKDGCLRLAHGNQNQRVKDQGRGRGSERTPGGCHQGAPLSAGALGPPLLRSPHFLRGLPGPSGLWTVHPLGLSCLQPPRLQSCQRLRGTEKKKKKKSRRVVRARAARGPGAAVFSVPVAQNIDLITPRKRGHNIFGCISKLN